MYCLIIKNKWTDHKYVYPVIYHSLVEAEKAKEIQLTKNVNISILQLI